MTTDFTYPISRNERRARLDEWLLAHREFVERETTTVVARELRKLGLYSAKTSLVDARVGVYRRCRQLGLACGGKSSGTTESGVGA